MKPKIHTSLKCDVCGRRFGPNSVTPIAILRDQITAEIRKEVPELPADGYICHEDLNRFRNAHVRSLIETEQGELTTLERDVINSLTEHESLTQNVEKKYAQALTPGERMADRLADFGGSWTFIGIFALVLVVWMTANTFQFTMRPFDPFPYILLNLVLSCLAAIQAPIIMMSQNRQEDRDRLRAENDYRINLKAELEIRHLHEKLDHLLRVQWDRLMEIQTVQIELMDELTKRPSGR